LKKVKSYKNIKEIKKKKNNNSLKKIRIKTFVENVRKQEKPIKDIADIYIKNMIKDLDDKIFKYHTYIEYYDIVLDFAKGLRFEKTSNIIFNKKFRISKEHLI